MEMKLTRLEKKIVKFVYQLAINPGFTKRKSLLHYLNVSEEDLNLAIDRLTSHELLKVTEKPTSHQGVCYELTLAGINIADDLNASVFTKLLKHPILSLIVALVIYLFTYLMDIFKPEIKNTICKLFN